MLLRRKVSAATLELPCLPYQSVGTKPGKAALQVARRFYIRLCSALETGRAARRVTTFDCKNRQGARRVVSTAPPACGWLRGTSRTSPGPPRRWRGPVWLRSTSARGRGFAAYLSACGGQPLQRPRCGLRQGRLRSLRSASSLPFLVTCWKQVIPSHSFAALAALIVRRVSAIATLLFVRRVSAIAALFMRRARVMLTDRCFACTGCTHAPWRGIGGRTRQRHLAAARPPGGALAGAPDSGTLPPAAVLCRRTYARTSEIPVFPPKTNCILQSPVYINNSVVTGRSPANSVNRKSSKSL